MNPFPLRFLSYVAALLLAASAMFGAYHHGLSGCDC